MEKIKISIIIPNYNNEAYLKSAIDCLLNQTYKNIEIIVVNDCSPGDCDAIMKNYDDKRIKYIKLDKNEGVFRARVVGSDAASGDYIGFLDADDYTTIDLYRSLAKKCEEKDYDIVVYNTILDYENNTKFVQNMRELDINFNPTSCLLDDYFRQEGLNFSWHTVCNKIYSMKLWKKARPYYDKIKNHLLMTEDFAFSTVLFYYAEAMGKIDDEGLFYRQIDSASTSVKSISYKKVTKNINDLITSFDFVENFLKEKNIFKKYEKKFYNWKHLYSIQHRYSINNSTLSNNDKEELNNFLDKFCSDKDMIDDEALFYMNRIAWDDRLEKLKKLIINPKIKVVSFDIFDTLVVRPVLKPMDLFRLLDNDYRKLKEKNNGISFSKMRAISENIARQEQEKNDPSIQEITLDNIYDTIGKLYDIDKKILNTMKEKENEIEIKFCTRRNTAFSLYELATHLGKTVICTSDMYLPEKTILSILNKNGYRNISKLFLSSTIKKTKSSGDLYKHVLNDLKIRPEEMIHIGDNYYSDVEQANKLKIATCHFMKTTDIMTDKKYTNCLSQMLTSSFPFWEDNRVSLDFIGIRTMVAVVANKYFDNPFRSFNKDTDFNADPYLIGYYALGMYQFGIAKWLVNCTKNNYDKISFMARDGYLAMESYKILKPLYDNLPDEEYIYVSRKALMPIMISDKSDFYKLSDLVSYSSQTPRKILKYINNILIIDNEKLEALCCKNDIELDSNFKNLESFNMYIKILVDNFYDDNIHMDNRRKLKTYFDNLLGKRAAVFDVGYSGRPEFYLSELLERNVDTFFLNINKDEALEYAALGNFKINTFFPAKPTATGNAYEHIISKNAPSCISYDLSQKSVVPIFEEYNNTYLVERVTEIMQCAALEFVQDMVDIFGNDIDSLYYQDYYIALPMLGYFNSTNEIDKSILSAVKFEDEIRTGNSSRMIQDMDVDLRSKNQQLLKDLNSCPYVLGKPAGVGEYEYNCMVDLNGKGKLARLWFYAQYDRPTFKRRIKEILRPIKRKIFKIIKKGD